MFTSEEGRGLSNLTVVSASAVETSASAVETGASSKPGCHYSQPEHRAAGQGAGQHRANATKEIVVDGVDLEASARPTAWGANLYHSAKLAFAQVGANTVGPLP